MFIKNFEDFVWEIKNAANDLAKKDCGEEAVKTIRDLIKEYPEYFVEIVKTNGDQYEDFVWDMEGLTEELSEGYNVDDTIDIICEIISGRPYYFVEFVEKRT